MKPDLDEIKRIKKEHEKRWLSKKGVVSVGIGKLQAGEIGIIIGYNENLQQLNKIIPEHIYHVKIELRRVDEINAV